MSHPTASPGASWSMTLRFAIAVGLGWGVLRHSAREEGLSTFLPKALLIVLVAAALHRYAIGPWRMRVVARRRIDIADLLIVALVVGIIVVLFQVI